jgi:hypothetical protein
MGNKISLKEWITKYDNGDFNSTSQSVMVKAGWNEWFCKNTILLSKLKKLAPLVKLLSKSSLINSEKVFVLFENNHPVDNDFLPYDSISICEIINGKMLYWIAPEQYHRNQKYSCILKYPWFLNNQLNKNERNIRGILKYFNIEDI